MSCYETAVASSNTVEGVQEIEKRFIGLGRSVVGASVRKKFDGGIATGKVTKFIDTDTISTYLVEYDGEGEEEEFEVHQLAHYLV